jgi:quinol monooxygenase YgiN
MQSLYVTQTGNPLVWHLDEAFVDDAAFKAHQARTRASYWFAVGQGLVRNFQVTES